MATVHRWISTDGDFGATGSWDTGTVPASAGDIAFFDGVDSQQDATLNLDRGTAVFQIKTAPEFTGNIGAAGNPLKWGMETSGSIIRGPGDVWLNIAVGVPGQTPTLVVNGSGVVTIEDVTASSFFLFCLDGTTKVNGGGISNSSSIAGVSAVLEINDPAVIQSSGAFHCFAGQAKITSALASGVSIHAHGGVVTLQGDVANSNRIAIASGAAVVLGKDISADVDMVAHVAGILDVSKFRKTVTAGNVFILPDGVIAGGVIEPIEGSQFTLDLNQEYP